LSQLSITKKDTLVNLGILIGNKRDPIFDSNDIWVDTHPLVINDLAGHEKRILSYQNRRLKKEVDSLKTQIKVSEQEDLKNINVIEQVQDINDTNTLTSLTNESSTEIGIVKQIYIKIKRVISRIFGDIPLISRSADIKDKQHNSQQSSGTSTSSNSTNDQTNELNKRQIPNNKKIKKKKDKEHKKKKKPG